MSENKKGRDHYVPKVLLRGFCDGKREIVSIFDKKLGRSFKSNIANVAAERGFYSGLVGGSGAEIDIEGILGRCEHEFRGCLDKIREESSLAVLGEREKAVVSLFVALQMLRTPHAREQLLHVNSLLSQKLKEMGVEDPVREVEGFEEIDQARAAKIANIMLLHPTEFANIISGKAWFLMRAASGCHFYIGDNPVARQNVWNENSLRGTLGLRSQGIEVYLPITASLTLCMFCEKMYSELVDLYESATRVVRNYQAASVLGVRPPPLEDAIRARRAEELAKSIKPTIVAIETGCAVEASKDNVENLNSLQVIYAERYVMASRSDSELADNMVKSDSTLRYGPRMQSA
ncbi:DUF4238 domain-containing protein [Azospirillum sp.]|uniref:DUF4238 domain-containing protein n=1 Tax=Azospirillum sp. TaxID=34012 RepID=UPI002D3F82D1|nr:DUF4238 domain-containing protein [Azospirillum sp.]HYD67026.1 DUF4238 domain-containing protein [Azospirillum sp.]